jgi:hypothetical protein
MPFVRLHHAFGVAFLYLISTNAPCQTLDQAFFSLQTALSVASEKARQAPEQLTDEQISKLRAEINTLQSISVQLPSEERTLYAKSLLHNAALIRLAALETDKARTASILADVDADLKVKSAARAGMAMASRFNGMVSVSVNTKRANSIVGGYIIILNPLQYRGSEPFVRFDKASSPSVGAVPPGRYELIAKRDGTEVRREIVTIGLDAQDSIALDFQVP